MVFWLWPSFSTVRIAAAVPLALGSRRIRVSHGLVIDGMSSVCGCAAPLR